MTKMPERFKARVKAMGVYVGSATTPEGRDVICIRNNDVTKAQEKQITKLAAECGLEIIVSDKGATFE